MPSLTDQPRPLLLVLCTGNYYRSRFAEFYFRALALQRNLRWRVESRGLEPHYTNPGQLSRHTIAECDRLGISYEPLRFPLALEASDLEQASLVIAMKEAEHRRLMHAKFPDWENRIEYWHIHDLDVAMPEDTLMRLRQHIDALADRLERGDV